MDELRPMIFPLYFRGKREGLLRLPFDLSLEDYEILKRQIDFSLETVFEALQLHNADGATTPASRADAEER